MGSAGWLLASWVITGLLTIAAALAYGELAAMMPRAGGQYVYLREAWSPLCGFLYGWTFFMVIQTGTVAAVGVGFARYLGDSVAAHLGECIPDSSHPCDQRLRHFALHGPIGRRADYRAVDLDATRAESTTGSWFKTHLPPPRSPVCSG